MRELGNLFGHQQLHRVDKHRGAERIVEKNVEKVDLDTKAKYTIDEILDRVEDGDVSVLVELGIPYTEITTEAGDKKISFKYEGIRYTVNIIENDGVEQTNNNIQTVNNDDGSYTVFEYDANGTLVKSTEYDKYGKITHEFKLNNDGSRSDKYYTYENGELVQIQETIHYTDGNYTYIFTDGKGNLKEEQKVIHNEQGGLTFDSTFGDGTRRVMVYNADNNLLNSTYYSSNRKVEKTEEYVYDKNNSDLYTVVTRNAEGKIVKVEKWEKYTYTDENGLTWYGSRVLARINYDQNEKPSEIIDTTYFENGSSRQIHKNANGVITLIIVLSKDGKVLKTVTPDDPEFLYELRKLSEDLLNELFANGTPQPPSRADYATDEEFEEAMKNYEIEKELFDTKMKNYNFSICDIELTTNLINTDKQVANFNQKIEILEMLMENAGKSRKFKHVNLKKLSKVVSNHKKTFERGIANKIDGYNKISRFEKEMASLRTPILPVMSQNMTEEEYAEAMKNYEYECNVYENKMNSLKAEIQKELQKIASIDMLLKRVEINVQNIIDNITKQLFN